MQIRHTPLPGLEIVELTVHGDARGFFIERFHAEKFAALGLPAAYAQDNHSRSAPGTLRGLHYQHDTAQGKLVGATRGRIWDVAVDIRADSPTFGQHFALELTGENGLLLWIPPGFAHGFCVLGDEPADLLYKVTTPYNRAGEGGIRYDDPVLGIDWPVTDLLLSERDRNLPDFAAYRENPVNWS